MQQDPQRIKKALVEAEERLYQSGFFLPSKVLHVVESMRARSPGELDYHGFLREAFCESLALDVPWQPGVRGRIPPAMRSPYLEELAGRQAKNSRWLDPNYSLYVEQPFPRRKELRHYFQEYKASEAIRHRELLMALTDGLSGSIPIIVARLMASLGFRKNPRSRGVWEFIEESNDPSAMAVTFQDVGPLQRDGWVIMQFSLPEFSPRPLGFNGCLLGSAELNDGNASVELIAYSIYAQTQYFRGLRAAFQSSGAP